MIVFNSWRVLMKAGHLFFLLCIVFLLTGCPSKDKKDGGQEANAPAAAEPAREADGDGWEVSEPLMENPTEEAPLEIVGGMVHDAGVVLSGAKKELSITLKNTSDKPFWLFSIEADCSCTNVDGIPGGKKFQPGEEWPMRILIDASRIAEGPFEKNVIITPTKFKPVRVKIKGVVEGFVRCAENRARRINFELIKRPDEKWSGSLNLTGFGSAEKVLELGMPKSENKKIDFKLEKTGEGSWKVTATPKAPLPYSSNYTLSVTFPVLKPENYPPVSVTVAGPVGATLRWESDHKPFLWDKDFDADGNVHIAYQLGHDVNGEFVHTKTAQKHIDGIVSNVDWKRLYDTLEIEEIPDVKITKKFTEQGVRLDVFFNKSVLQSKPRIIIKTGCNGNWEFPGLLLKYRKSLQSHSKGDSSEK